MGNCWCQNESPCGSAEERSELLKDDSKTTCTSERAAVGTCGPEADDNMRRTIGEEAVEVNAKQQKLENKELEPKNTQENGHLQRENVQEGKEAASEASEVKKDSAGEKHEERKDSPAQKCTLHSPGKGRSTADGEDGKASKSEPDKEENPASGQETKTDGVSSSAEAVCPETPPHSETNPSTGRVTASHADAEDESSSDAITTVAKPPGESSVPKPEAAAASSEVSQEKEAPSCTLAEGLDNSGSSPCREEASEGTSLSSPGLDRSEEKLDSTEEPEATAPYEARNSFKSDTETKADPKSSSAAELNEVTSFEKTKQDAAEETVQKDVPKEKDDGIKEEEVEGGSLTGTEAAQEEKDPKIQEVTEKEDELGGSLDTKADDGPATEVEEEILEGSEEDLYRGAEEQSASQILSVADRCSLSPAVDILSYSEREWKGNTAKSALIKEGYKEMSQKFDGVRRVRGDNYCALRATLFQVLSQSTKLPLWLQEDDVLLLPKQLEAEEGLISQWRFPGECVQGDGDAAQRLKGYTELLQNTWKAAVDCPSAAERQKLCERVFQGGEEELGLLEAIKLLMLGRAVELHSCMLGGGEVPLFCWLLFARDTSGCPRSFLSNHLRHVGLSAGLEQVEMFLLGYALQHTIQVYRLYKANTEEFITFYPDDHKDDWPSVCLVTEDDRHYNVPVVEAAELQELASS
uniref:Family with sequence similarity 105, member B, a n=3 Tax=Iconisemion striatum TaxID=60296 RepID=A0A1A7XFN9_9TELE